ncbi:50S ribosomal protein L21 [Bradyrhizobium manausense]|nr:50S ribosomal protein L21 [Bradyrhizobium manausense]
MFAVIKTGGKQYRVAPDDVLEVPKIAGDVGTTVNIDEVLVVGGDNPILGAPTVAGASVAAEVLGQHRAPKVIVFKKRRRKSSKRTRGYRDQFTLLRITEIRADGRVVAVGVAQPAPRTRDRVIEPATSSRPQPAGRLFRDLANGLFRNFRETDPAPSSSGRNEGRYLSTFPTTLEIVEGFGNPSADKRVAALAQAAEVISGFDRSNDMDRSERLRQATLPRRIYEKLFDADKNVARQAAYTLVVSSKSFNRGRKPGRFDQLAREEVDGVRKDLQQLLPKLGRRFFSYVYIERVEKTAGALDASIRIRVSRALPFQLNDKPVIVDGPKPAPDASFTVMSASSASAELKRRYTPDDKEWADGDLFVADCKVHLPLRKGQVINALPIAFAVDGLGTTRRELKIDTKVAHRAA